MTSLTRRTCWALGIAAAVLEAAAAVINGLGYSMGALGTFAALAVGCTMLLLATTEKHGGKVQTVFMLSALCVLLSMLGGILGLLFGALVWPLCAACFIKADADKRMTTIVIGLGAVQLLAAFIPGGKPVYVAALVAGVAHILWCVRQYKATESDGDGE